MRYELRSNAAGSEQGLHRFPALEDLVQTFAAHDVEVAFVREVFREEGEVNLASGRHAQGVTVRGKTVRALAPETHVRGCLAWARAVAASPERGLHAHLPQLRTTNGAALVIAQALARGRHAFVSGLDATAWLRLTTPADPACKAVPEPIAQNEALYRDYLGRASRPTGFMAALERLLRLTLLPADLGGTAREILAARDPSGLKRLNQAQIVNVALLDELVERYERLVEQFCAQLGADSALGELPQLFDLLMQGAAPDKLHARFVEFALPERREAIEGRRGLLHELRIGLQNGDDVQREGFQRRLLGDVVRLRRALDPRTYARAHRLDEVDSARLEALSPPRQWFLAWQRDGGQQDRGPQDREQQDGGPPTGTAGAGSASAATQPPAGAAEGALPPAVTQGLFELIVQLVYQARYAQPVRAGSEPPAVLLARGLLEQVRLERFDLRRLHRLHPGLPARGVAGNLAGKVPVTRGELDRIRTVLGEALFPLERVAAPVARELAARRTEVVREQALEARGAFLRNAWRLLASMNYVVGRADPDPMLRQAALAVGRSLGLTMLASRDEIRRRTIAEPAAAEPADEALRAEGYQLLLVRDGARWFPLRAAPSLLAETWRYLLRERVAQAVRNLVAKKLNYLVERHGAGLFALLHDHITAQPGLALSARQFAELLVEARLFDAARLREFGYAEGDPSPGHTPDEANPWLAALQEREGPAALEPFLGSRSEAACRAARRELEEAVEAYGAPAGADDPALRGALAALAAEEHYDLHDPAARAALARTREAEALTALLAELVGTLAEHPADERWAAAREGNEALELPLPGDLAPLALLRERHALDTAAGPLQVRLLPATRQALPGGVPGAVVQGLAERLRAAANGPLPGALRLLQRHLEAWRRLVQAAALPLLDQMLRETVLRIVEPQGLQPAQLRALPEGQVLCLGASAHDQARFGRVVARPERREAFATLSELASRLLRFGRLREELAWYRELIGDLREIIAGLNLSTYDAPYILRYGRALGELSAALAVRPEEFAAADLAEVQRLAQSIGALVRSFYEQERGVGLRDRWMSRISMRLRTMHPTVRLTFVDDLHEQARAPTPEEEAEADAPAAQDATRKEDHQTFSERVRNVVEFRARMDAVRAFVLSPNNTQRRLALGVIDQLYRLKGVHTAIFVDVSGCEDLLDVLRTRIPAHRLFDLNAL